MDKMSPETCGDSLEVGGMYICALECLPCPMHFGKDCVVLRQDRALDALRDAISEARKEIEMKDKTKVVE